MEARVERLLDTAASTCVLPLDDGARAQLRKIVLSERAAVLTTAARFAAQAGRPAVDVDSLRLACSTHQLLQPPLRPHCEFHASVVNSLPAAWPMDGALVVPLAAAGMPEPRGAGAGVAPPPPPQQQQQQPPQPPQLPAAGFSLHVPLADLARTAAAAAKRPRVGAEEEA
jgi:hypothetical protein